MVTLLLDVEGTLLDSRPATRAGLLRAWSELYPEVAPPASETIDQAVETGELYAVLAPAAPQGLRELASRYELEWIARGHLALYPGIEAMLERAHRSGYRLALVTLGTGAYTRALIAACGLERWLHCWFCRDDGLSKTALVEQASRELGRPGWLLGDRPADWEAAQHHGLGELRAGWSYTCPPQGLAHPLDLFERIG